MGSDERFGNNNAPERGWEVLMSTTIVLYDVTTHRSPNGNSCGRRAWFNLREGQWMLWYEDWSTYQSSPPERGVATTVEEGSYLASLVERGVKRFPFECDYDQVRVRGKWLPWKHLSWIGLASALPLWQEAEDRTGNRLAIEAVARSTKAWVEFHTEGHLVPSGWRREVSTEEGSVSLVRALTRITARYDKAVGLWSVERTTRGVTTPRESFFNFEGAWPAVCGLAITG